MVEDSLWHERTPVGRTSRMKVLEELKCLKIINETPKRHFEKNKLDLFFIFKK